jgi:hypothetical protein
LTNPHYQSDMADRSIGSQGYSSYGYGSANGPAEHYRQTW